MKGGLVTISYFYTQLLKSFDTAETIGERVNTRGPVSHPQTGRTHVR
jgi:hypothetical protein